MQNRLIQIWDHALLGFFKQEFEKALLIFEVYTAKFAKMHKFFSGSKMPYFGLNLEKLLSYQKSALYKLQIWDQKCLIWVYFGCDFEKTIVIFEIITLEFDKMQSFLQK